ncbi:hypothetical protein EV361DRAFT_957324 [Lentinula raphanica]|nr:hypothetical protein EV361DRAFT_957324 [Lentinula raphanica]
MDPSLRGRERITLDAEVEARNQVQNPTQAKGRLGRRCVLQRDGERSIRECKTSPPNEVEEKAEERLAEGFRGSSRGLVVLLLIGTGCLQ